MKRLNKVTGHLRGNYTANDTSIDRQLFGKIGDDEVYLYTIHNSVGMKVEILNYGGHIKSIFVPNKNGKLIDVIIGMDNLDDYINHDFYSGCIVGRYANRLKNGEFMLNNKIYKIRKQNKIFSTHGGLIGFNKKIWNAKYVNNKDAVGVELQYLSKDGEQGYPGNLNVKVLYLLNKYRNDLIIKYICQSDKDTIINLTNHAYFNLDGKFIKNGIYDHKIRFNSQYITEYDNNCLTTGKLYNVENTPFDFRYYKDIGKHINASYNELIKIGKGYDHNYVINGYQDINQMKHCCTVKSSNVNNIRMNVYTTEPGVQFYTCNWLDGRYKGKGYNFEHRSAFALETQNWPDAIHHKHFPNSILRKNEVYKSQTIYSFDTFTNPSTTESDNIISALKLIKHPEGGYYLPSYRSGCTNPLTGGKTDITGLTVQLPNNKIRNLASCIYWLQRESDSNYMLLHKTGYDTITYYHKGNGLRYYIINSKTKQLSTVIVGPNINKGHKVQLMIPRDCWFGAELLLNNDDNSESYTLVSEVCCPGFDFNDWSLISWNDILKLKLSHHHQMLLKPMVSDAKKFKN